MINDPDEWGNVIVAGSSLRQWALDFSGNQRRIEEAITEAKRLGASLLIGPEQETCGYMCEDHFLEKDTELHSWQTIANILSTDLTNGIVVVSSLPVSYSDSLYNCCIVMLNKKVILVRPKLYMAEDIEFREGRWFTSWDIRKAVDHSFKLPECVQKVTGQVHVPFGVASLRFDDCVIGIEICQELFQVTSPHQSFYLDGADIVINGNGSSFVIGKMAKRTSLVMVATSKFGGGYFYTNNLGADGDRILQDGHQLASQNGEIIMDVRPMYTMREVVVSTVSFSLRRIRQRRISEASIMKEANYGLHKHFEEIRVHGWQLAFRCRHSGDPVVPTYKTGIESVLEIEFVYAAAHYLWVFLLRSGGSGFFLPLSGGVDSCMVGFIVYTMCEMLLKEFRQISQRDRIEREIRSVLKREDYVVPSSSKELCQQLLCTVYEGTKNSSGRTRSYSRRISDEIGSNHFELNIDQIVDSQIKIVSNVLEMTPKFKAHGGTNNEDLALQNVQARSRMVLSYLIAQMYREGDRFLIVLGSSNKDEMIRGFLTKYDNSSADINPLGDVSKKQIKAALSYMRASRDIPLIDEILNQAPTAELVPLAENGTVVQEDEVDMGLKYEELEYFGHLRKNLFCGPLSMFYEVAAKWTETDPAVIADKVKRFFRYYAMNRHKSTTVTPAIHAANDSNEDNRCDLRPFYYNLSFEMQFKKIDETVLMMKP